MRGIDLSKLNPSESWRAKAKRKQDDVNSGACEPKDVGSLWGELKDELKELSNKKCWYCESRQDRSDNAVDHFRPKSIYPWLACEYTNFRFSCTFCNSIRKNPDTGKAAGKGDHFPLLRGDRATSQSKCRSEAHLLIDPCKAADVRLLTFKDDGKPYPSNPQQHIRASRAIESIKYYHLDHPDLNEARRELALQLEEWIEAADLILDDDQIETKQEATFNTLYTTLIKAMDKDSQFSMFARKVVKGFRDRNWVDDLLDGA